jgi:hypothetical protein
LELGDNFVVNAKEGNEEGVEFYVMLCTQLAHILKEDYTCHWGIQFQAGDVVARTYYQKWEIGEKTYVLLHRSHTVYLHVSHV